MAKRIISTKGAPGALGPYSQGIGSGKFVFLSGQLGLDPATGALVPGGAAAEAARSLENLRAVLAEAGLLPVNVVKTTIFLKDMADFQAVNEVYGRFFGGDYPARSTVQVAALPKGGMVEIEAIACGD
jgi:2-iminobutanoate/2-iminopropanoate deaminase